MILTALLFLIFGLLPTKVSLKSGFTTLYVTKTPLLPNHNLSINELTAVSVALPPVTATHYLSPNNFKTYRFDTVNSTIGVNSLIPLDSLEASTINNTVQVPLTFEVAPPLTTGDVVDILAAVPANNNLITLTTILTNITLQSGSGNTWTVDVPIKIAPALLYVGSTDSLDAMLVNSASTPTVSPPITSNSQALHILQGVG